ncbi:MAG: cytochrome-c peroxidase [Nannocystaceae bacterium]
MGVLLACTPGPGTGSLTETDSGETSETGESETGESTGSESDTSETGETDESEGSDSEGSDTLGEPVVCDYDAEAIVDRLDLPSQPYNYENQDVPDYINRDNTGENAISDDGATLGRVLFYDKRLSTTDTIACASCHQQERAFGDEAQASVGVNGSTGRHSMRLVNTRFAAEQRFFWDERAATLEEQTTMPIRDHAEMGYSGVDGDPSFDDLLAKLQATDEYPVLFTCAFGDDEITEQRMQLALAQFVRSIQSFDSKYDEGREQVPGEQAPFPNFTEDENAGKQLWLAPPMFDPQGSRIGGGAGCGGCHRAPEFDIDPMSGNNGNVHSLNDTGFDFDVTRAPSLRDIYQTNGVPNGPLMHTGDAGFSQVLDIYDNVAITPENQQLDPRLRPMGMGQRLNLTGPERAQLEAFARTLSGSDMYTNVIWSDPFYE